MNDTGVTFGLNPTVGRGAPAAGRRHFLVGQRNPVAEIEHCCWPGCSRDRYPDSDAPPLCGGHLVECATYATGGIRVLMNRALGEPRIADPFERIDGSVVYYVRIGDHVKIGTTTNLKDRLQGLHATPDALLATEPGDRAVERERHAQFRQERVYLNRELFNPSRRLLDHIQSLQPE